METLFQKCACSSTSLERSAEREKKRKKLEEDDDEASKRVTFDKILQKGAGLKKFLGN